MKDTLISFETAVLAKEKGFDIPTLYGCNEKGELQEYITYASYSPGEPEITIFDFIQKWEYQLPTQSFLQKWLREIHNIHIVLFGFINNTYWHYEIYTLDKAIIEFDLPSIKHGNTYEEALETGLQEALKLITLK